MPRLCIPRRSGYPGRSSGSAPSGPAHIRPRSGSRQRNGCCPFPPRPEYSRPGGPVQWSCGVPVESAGIPAQDGVLPGPGVFPAFGPPVRSPNRTGTQPCAALPRGSCCQPSGRRAFLPCCPLRRRTFRFSGGVSVFPAVLRSGSFLHPKRFVSFAFKVDFFTRILYRKIPVISTGLIFRRSGSIMSRLRSEGCS